MFWEFIKENFFYLHPGYTLLNTIVFGIVLGLIIIIVIKMFKFIKKDPKELLITVVPFIFFGSSTRALVDAGIYPLTYILVTPGIYILTGGITLISLFVGLFIENKTKIDYRYTMILVGILLCIPNILKIHHLNFIALSAVIGIWALVSSIFIILRDIIKVIRNKFNLSVLLAHLFDASSTFVAVDFYGYGEQHVLPSALTNLLGTASVMYPLKIAVILFALYVIDRYIEDRITRNTLKLAIFILGLAPGLRNVLSLSMCT